MNVTKAYAETWRRRGVVVPIFLAVRALALAVILPLTGALVAVAVALSGQSALTDQDIAHFIFTPIGFAAFLVLAIVIMLGSVIGLATMTVDLQSKSAEGIAAFWRAVRLIGLRLPKLASYALRLVLRILLIVLPFAGAALLVADRLIGEFDINYYLYTKPPELYVAGAIIGALLSVMTFILLNRLTLWAVSLHLVLFSECPPAQSFGKSAERMQGQRLRLLRDLGLWFAIRAVAVVLVGIVFGWLLRHVTDDFGTGFRLKLALTLIFAALWTLCGFLISAIALGTLARVLNDYFGEVSVADLPVSGLLSRRRVWIGAAALLGVGVVVGAQLVSQVRIDNEVEVIAHRGAAGLKPENTMASVRQAVEDGADWVEIDVQETADGEIAVIHDSDFMKLAGVDLKIWDATMEDLAGIDIGSWFDPAYAQERTPLLREVLETVRDRSRLLIELKYYGHDVDLEQRTINIVEAAGMADQVATMSLKYPAVQKMKTLRPGWSSGVLAATAVGNLSQLDGDFVAVNAGMVGPKLVRAVQAQGKKLYVWTVNDPLQMSAMMSMGVDGLITDAPGLARSVIAARSELSTPERIFILFVERFGLTLDDDLAGRDDSP
jgi:glycerophosphoryl diester phosphodiesterase